MVGNTVNRSDYLKYAADMVSKQIRSRGITNPKILELMENIPRHLFVKGVDMECAYSDFPLPIGFSQTISQPYMVAYMTNLLLLTGNESVLEIGTGSGYQTSLLASLAARVYTVEKIAILYERSKQLLEAMGYTNISFRNGDGSAGWKEHAPFNRIIVTGALPAVADILKHQLAEDGILIAPVGNYQTSQVLLKIERRNNQYHVIEDLKCQFVPILGKYGF